MRLLVRVDASMQIGTGHVMRCLALAQAWQDVRGDVVFIMATGSLTLQTRLESEGMKVFHLSVQLGSTEDAKETASLAHQLDASWVVMDGYHFGAEYQAIIKDSGLHLLFIDDYGHANQYYADIVLNQNIYAHERLYTNRQPYTQLLLGTRYVLLRREFCQWQGWQRPRRSPVASKLLVTLGGADPDNLTLKVIQELQMVETKGLEVVIVLGGSNPHYKQLQSFGQELRFPICIERNVLNMPELMAWADVAVAAGGSTSWEIVFMGLPSLVLILAENQRAIAENLDRIGVTINLGWHEDVAAGEIAEAVSNLLMSPSAQIKMTRSGQELVDGKGSVRVMTKLSS